MADRRATCRCGRQINYTVGTGWWHNDSGDRKCPTSYATPVEPRLRPGETGGEDA